MSYRKVNCIEQIWYSIKYSVTSWLEWRDAKRWAKQYFPVWVKIEKLTKNDEVRQHYRNMILETYREF